MGAYSSLFGIYYLSAASHHVRISNMYFHTIRFDIQSSIKYYFYLLSVYLKFFELVYYSYIYFKCFNRILACYFFNFWKLNIMFSSIKILCEKPMLANNVWNSQSGLNNIKSVFETPVQVWNLLLYIIYWYDKRDVICWLTDTWIHLFCYLIW